MREEGQRPGLGPPPSLSSHSSPVTGREQASFSGGDPGGGHTDSGGCCAGMEAGPQEREPPAWGQGQRHHTTARLPWGPSSREHLPRPSAISFNLLTP